MSRRNEPQNLEILLGWYKEETRVQSLVWEDTLEEGMATHSSTLAWRVPMDRGAWRATVHGFTQSRTRLNDKAHTLFHMWK